PDARYADASEMLGDIEAALHELKRPATGRVIAAQVARWAPKKGASAPAQENGTAPTAASYKSDPRTAAPPSNGTDATYVAQKSLAPMPAAKPRVPVGRASTV